MKLLLKQVLIADKHSPFNGLYKDILIHDGIIRSIENVVTTEADKIIEGDSLIVSQGWVDIFSHFCDPGIEYKETLETGAMASAAGGFVYAFVIPNTTPAIASKSLVEYVTQKSGQLPVNILPLGAITKNTEGKELAEMYDMRNSGAIAFTDGLKPVQIPGLFLKALQYVNAFDGVLIQMPIDTTIGSSGLMNEGITSTRLGLQGIPEISEELIVARDLELAKYANSNVHITGITTAKSVALIKQAKQENVKVTVSVTPYHLFYCDEDLLEYDTNLKVNPPLRARKDVEALKQAVEDGIIDCIASHHLPQDWDNKTCEFEYAKNGMIGLQTVFNVVNTSLPNLSTQRLVELLGFNARSIFKLPQNIIQEGAIADLTIFSRNGKSVLTRDSNKSKSFNSPFVNKELKGCVIGVVNKDKVYLNQLNNNL